MLLAEGPAGPWGPEDSASALVLLSLQLAELARWLS